MLPPRADYLVRSATASRACGSVFCARRSAANSEKAVDEPRVAARQLRKLGASVDEVSVPLHAAGTAIWLPIAAEGRRSR